MKTTIDNQIKEIVSKYLTALKSGNVSTLSSGEKDKLDPCYLYLIRIEKAFSKLNDLEKLIINNEYFFNAYYGWWEEIFTKKTFIKYRAKVARKFVRYVYENI